MKTKVLECSSYERQAIVIFIGLAFVLAGLYGFFVKQTVYHLVERKVLQRETVFLSSEVSSLESKYLNLTKEVTLDLAQELGFRENKSVLYVSRGTSVDGLSLIFTAEDRSLTTEN